MLKFSKTPSPNPQCDVQVAELNNLTPLHFIQYVTVLSVPRQYHLTGAGDLPPKKSPALGYCTHLVSFWRRLFGRLETTPVEKKRPLLGGQEATRSGPVSEQLLGLTHKICKGAFWSFKHLFSIRSGSFFGCFWCFFLGKSGYFDQNLPGLSLELSWWQVEERLRGIGDVRMALDQEGLSLSENWAENRGFAFFSP